MKNSYSYQVFEADDHSNARVEAARKSFGHEDTACYVISINGQMNTIQFDQYLPYPGGSLQESAENHIAQMVADNEQE